MLLILLIQVDFEALISAVFWIFLKGLKWNWKPRKRRELLLPKFTAQQLNVIESYKVVNPLIVEIEFF